MAMGDARRVTGDKTESAYGEARKAFDSLLRNRQNVVQTQQSICRTMAMVVTVQKAEAGMGPVVPYGCRFDGPGR